MPAPEWPVLSYAFRPFFLAGAAFAIAATGWWLAFLHAMPVPVGADPVLWHAHEMLFGFAGAAVAGFLLTAVATWTGRPPVAGALLAVLVLAWMAGRAALLMPWLPAAAVAAADLAFPVLLAAVAGREVVAGGSRRNYGIAAGVGTLALLDVVFHLGRSGVWPGADRTALYLVAHGLLVLITVIGGRIIPSFTGNWLRLRGAARLPRARAPVEQVILPLAILAGVADSLAWPPAVTGGLAIAVAGVHAVRLSGWRGLATGREPLVLILHVAYAWLPVGYLLLGRSALGLPLPRSTALHALTMGAIGTMILAVATRVALGHTGRPLVAATWITAAYVVLNVGVMARLSGVPGSGAYLGLLDVAAACWMAAFGLFLAVYAPILTTPRHRSTT